MYPTTQATGVLRVKEKWSKLTYDQRMGILVQTIQILKNMVDGHEKTMEDLRRHKHNEQNGTPYVTNDVSGGFYAQESPRGPSPIQHLPIDDFDFEELKII